MLGSALRSSRILRAASLTAMASLGVGVVLLALASPLGASPSQTTNPSVAQGGTATVSGTLPINKACPASATVTLTSGPGPGGANLFPNGVGPQVTRNSSGGFSIMIRVPLSTPVGSYPISVTCAGKAGSVETLDVTAAVSTKPSLSVSPAAAAPGSTVTFSGQVPTANGVVTCAAGEATQLSGPAALFPPAGAGPPLSRGTNGTFSQPYRIPSNTPASTYSVGVRCGGGSLVASVNVQVTGTATTTTSSSTTTTTVAKSTTTTSLVPATLVPPGGQATTTLEFPTVPSISATDASTNKGGLSISALGLIGLILVVVAFVIAIVVYSVRP